MAKPLSGVEIAERARLADSRTTYEPRATPPLERIKLRTSEPAPSAGSSPTPDNSTQLTKLLDTVSKLSDQVAELLEENRKLRAASTNSHTELRSTPVKPRVNKRIARQAKPS